MSQSLATESTFFFFFNNAVPNWGKTHTHTHKSTQRECLVNILNLFVKD